MTIPYADMELHPAPERYGDDYSNPGERCPVTDPFWCSRDRYHPGAHVNRSATGPGMIGWPNTTEPVGMLAPQPRPPGVTSTGMTDPPRSGMVMVYAFVALVVAMAVLVLLAATSGRASEFPAPVPTARPVGGSPVAAALHNEHRAAGRAAESPGSESVAMTPAALNLRGLATAAARAVIPPSLDVPASTSSGQVSSSDVRQGREGTVSHVGPGYPADYLALPIGAGHRVRVCGPRQCLTLVSTDAGPNRASLRAGRIADVSVELFRKLCGCPPSRGLFRGSWRLTIPLPETSTVEGETP